MTNKLNLNPLRIVLLNTFHPGNIGAVARAMKTMGLTELVLVNPREHPSDEATSRAAGAADLLNNAKVVSDLSLAIADCTQVFATTARHEFSFAGPQNNCEEAAKWIVNHPNEKIAILFGGERSGLTADDIQLCQQVLTIPGNPDYDILNLAAAVQIVCYDVNKALSLIADGKSSKPVTSNEASKLVNQQDLESFYQQLESQLQSSGYINPKQPSSTMKKLRHLFNRANPTAADISMMRGIIKSLNRQA